jgi:hypothetical protein
MRESSDPRGKARREERITESDSARECRSIVRCCARWRYFDDALCESSDPCLGGLKWREPPPEQLFLAHRTPKNALHISSAEKVALTEAILPRT